MRAPLCLDHARQAVIPSTIACLMAAAVLAALSPAMAGSGAPTPLKQMDAGAGAGDILCNAGRMLLVSPGGTPACVFAGSAGTLTGRGWMAVPAGDGDQGSMLARSDPGATPPAPGAPDPRQAAEGGIASAPHHGNLHNNTLTISKYPAVGEVADVTFTVTANRDGSFGNDPLARLVVGAAPGHDSHRIFDVVSNIGTGDPDVFRPYDHDNVTTVARLGETYTVKAKLEIIKEGFLGVHGGGLHGDIVSIYIAASKNVSMNTDEYEATGQTYLDHTMATGQEESRIPEPDIGVSVPGHVVNRTTLLGEYRPMYSSFAETYIELNYTEDQIVDELFYWGYLRSDIREFFVHIMNYTEAQADAVRMGDDLLGSAYMASPAGIDEVVLDMLTRRNYTAAETRDLLRDHMFYTDDEAAALVLDATATRAQAGAAGQQQPPARAGPFTVSGKVYAAAHFSRTLTMPIHGVRVCAYDYDDSTTQTTLLRTSSSGEACTVTAQSGTYVIANIRNNDPNDTTTVDLLVRVLSAGSRLSVEGTSGMPYIHDEPVVGNFSGSALDGDITLSGPSAGAGRIIDAISDGRRFFEGHSIRNAP